MKTSVQSRYRISLNRRLDPQLKAHRRVPSPLARVLEITRTIGTPSLVLSADTLCRGVGAWQTELPRAQRHSAAQQQPKGLGLPAVGYPARTWPKYPIR